MQRTSVMNACVISIGNELLRVSSVDTNSIYLRNKLLSVGIPVTASFVVPDDAASIIRTLRFASEDCNLLFLTGGLGSTPDDLTREALAQFLHKPLKLRKELLAKMENFFTRRHLPMPGVNKQQAYFPEGTEPIDNTIGTASGIKARNQDKLIIALPGVPVEMTEMFESHILGELKATISRRGQSKFATGRINCFGKTESDIVSILGEILSRNRNPVVDCTINHGVVSLYIVAEANTGREAQEMVLATRRQISGILGSVVYSTGEASLSQVAGGLLSAKRKTIAIAESCTGGLLAKLLTEVPGSSRYFSRGWITYSNQSKSSELAVPMPMIKKYGAVSPEVAGSMAENACRKADTDFAVGITGIAGPGGGSKQKPVGMVYISVASKDQIHTRKFLFAGEREAIRYRAAMTALNMVRLSLLQFD